NFSISAASIQVQPSNKIQARGIVETSSSSSITVNGTTFGVTGGTKFADKKGLPINASEIHSGSVAQPKGFVEDTTLTASEVDVEDDDNQGENEDIQVDGIIEALSASSITVSGMVFQVTPSTEVEGDIAVGNAVTVEGMDQNGTLIATQIQHIDDGD